MCGCSSQKQRSMMLQWSTTTSPSCFSFFPGTTPFSTAAASWKWIYSDNCLTGKQTTKLFNVLPKIWSSLASPFVVYLLSQHRLRKMLTFKRKTDDPIRKIRGSELYWIPNWWLRSSFSLVFGFPRKVIHKRAKIWRTIFKCHSWEMKVCFQRNKRTFK